MAHIILFPRLSRLGVVHLLSGDGLTEKPLTQRMDDAEPFVRYGSSGGARATNAELQNLRDGVIATAQVQGFPKTASHSAKSNFDTALSIWFGECPPISEGEALRDDVWAFIATVLLPDIVLWRYGSVTERFHGGVRNTLQRLWIRGHALDRGNGKERRWQLVRELSEDATVQIIERPSVAANPRLALAIGEAWVRTAAEIGTPRMEGVTRLAVRNLRIANEVLHLAALDDGPLDHAVESYFQAAANLQKAPEAQAGQVEVEQA